MSINKAMMEALPGLATLPSPPRIVHQTGTDMEESVRAAYQDHYPAGLFEIHPFLDDMPARLEAADLVVCRAGATTLAELAAAGRPAILVPFPFAADDHQRHNAEAVADAGAARVVMDADLSGELITILVGELTGRDGTLAEMGESARKLAVPGAAGRIAGMIEEMIGIGSTGGVHVS
jgi:UDP-N-acetylglucosamine--N-acetylmuramyl-(pentapeptide) pyrophosphoryl-undecaprenol N-acetylglucosamine transferase